MQKLHDSQDAILQSFGIPEEISNLCNPSNKLDMVSIANFRINLIRLKTRFEDITTEEIDDLKRQVEEQFKLGNGVLPDKAMVLFRTHTICVNILKGH